MPDPPHGYSESPMEQRLRKLEELALATNGLAQSNNQTINQVLLPMLTEIKASRDDINDLKFTRKDVIREELKPVEKDIESLEVENNRLKERLDILEGQLTGFKIAVGVGGFLVTTGLAILAIFL